MIRHMHVLARGDLLQRLRLSSGLVLFTFAATHFLNHALGLVSLDAMQAMQAWRKVVTRSWIGSGVLLAAFLTHILLALYKMSRRLTWRLPPWEAAQIVTGLSVPLLLITHVVYNRGAARSPAPTTPTPTSSATSGRASPGSTRPCCWSCGCTAASACTTG